MKTYTHLQILSLGFILFCSVAADAKGGAGRVNQTQPAGDRPVAIDNALPGTDDALGAWLTLHGDQFGLYDETPERAQAREAQASAISKRFMKRAQNEQAIAETVEIDPQQMRIDRERLTNLDGLITATPQVAAPTATEKKVFTPPETGLRTEDPAVQVSAAMEDLKFGGACSQFATSRGFGPLGKHIVKEFRAGLHPELEQGTDDIRSYCPRFDNLTLVQKSAVYVMFVASGYFGESTCDPDAGFESKVHAVNGRAGGLAQLHVDQEHRYSAGCNKGDSRSATRTISCTLAMLGDQVKRSAKAFDPKSYWSVFRPQGERVKVVEHGRRITKIVVKSRLVKGGLKELSFCQNAYPIFEQNRIRSAQGSDGAMRVRASGGPTIR